ncbi:uncharacterized protein LOC143035144 [Oratosquilla oratoria]|uniref:uncharacterized protein LOC143035144 n=1 Tax=Oratosquilla oratoria TaxID=337810 RepID=UPI003F75B10E
MGQCHNCVKREIRPKSMKLSIDAAEEEDEEDVREGSEDIEELPGCSGVKAGHSRKGRGSDSALDSGHSSDEGSCGDPRGTRNSHSSSSESSGKYSLRDSDIEQHHHTRAKGRNSIDKSKLCPNYHEDDPSPPGGDGGLPGEDCVLPLSDICRSRKVSHESCFSDRRSSQSSVSSFTAALRVRLGRSTSLRSQGDEPMFTAGSSIISSLRRGSDGPRRCVSLRLPRSHRRTNDGDTNLPTIYVDESPKENLNSCLSSPDPAGSTGHLQRKSSLRRAFSLSLNSMGPKHEGSSSAASAKSQPKAPKKILRQPRRRHHTVRGLSGLAIDDANQSQSPYGLQRAHTLYYPTATSMRRNNHTRRYNSVTS